MSNPILKEALTLLRLGYSVIPVKERSKEPAVMWQKYQKERASEEQVRQWFEKSSLNLGVVCGAISNLAVLDFDGEKGLAYLNYSQLSSTLVSITGKGKQLWYRTSSETKIGNSVCKISDGVDVRGEGGFVVAPPSIHPNGRRYRFLNVPMETALLLDFPVSLLQSPNVPVQTVSKADGWIGKALEEMKHGNIDDTLFSLCSRLRADGYTAGDARVLLDVHARNAGAVDGHLDEKIANVWSRYPAGKGYTTGASSNGGLTIHRPTDANSKIAYQQSLSKQAASSYHTGFRAFDSLTGGLKKGEILTVAARTGVGKSNFLIGASVNLCRQGKNVLYFSTEMSFDQIWGRYIALLRKPSDFEGHLFGVCDEFTPSIERIEECLKKVRPEIIIFDHINNVSEDHQGLGEFMKGIKFLARKFDIPCILAAQLNRGADWVQNGERVEPRLSMIKGSGSIEEVSAQVLLLSEKRVTDEVTEIMGIVDKNRWGQKGLLNFGLFQNPWRIREI